MEGRMKDRIDRAFARRPLLVAFVTAGDPDFETSRAILHALPDAGVDIVELGMPFSDPTADGPAIEAASVRALGAGHGMMRTFDLVRSFRAEHADVPLVLFGYFNPVHAFGVSRFLDEAEKAGADGFLIVDLPAEYDAEFCDAARARNFAMIRLVAPTTPEAKLPRILEKAGGFVYNIAIAGITGTTSATAESVELSVARIRAKTNVPVATGFGVKTPAQAREVAARSDAVVVGSAIVERIGKLAELPQEKRAAGAAGVLDFVRELAVAVRG
jgi:tryptophan synthase alpha chain